MSQPNYCPFCDTEQTYRHVIETERMRVIYPKAPGCKFHVLITPKRHVETFDQLNVDEVKEAHELVQKLVGIVRSNYADFVGYNLLSNNGGPAVRQHIMHSHLHVFLRLKSDTGDPLVPPDSATPPEFSDVDKQNLKELKQLFD
jgi:ATP adenylyltransferase